MKRINVGPAITFFILALAGELIVRGRLIPDYILPAPSQVALTLWMDRDEYARAGAATARSAFAGLALSIIFGTLVATLLATSRHLRRAIFPYAIFFQTVPVVGIAPLLVIWFGFGTWTVIASAFLVSVFPIIASTLLGLESTDTNLEELFRMYRAPRLAYWWKLKLPSALPDIFNGFHIAVGLSIIGTIVGEFVAGGGLGAVIDSSRTQQRVDKVFAAILLSSLLGAFAVKGLAIIQKKSLGRWHASQAKGDLS